MNTSTAISPHPNRGVDFFKDLVEDLEFVAVLCETDEFEGFEAQLH